MLLAYLLLPSIAWYSQQSAILHASRDLGTWKSTESCFISQQESTQLISYEAGMKYLKRNCYRYREHAQTKGTDPRFTSPAICEG